MCVINLPMVAASNAVAGVTVATMLFSNGLPLQNFYCKIFFKS